jgi:hypothetical protein
MAFSACKAFAVLGLLVGCCTHQALGFSAAPPLLRNRVPGAQHAPQVMTVPVTLRPDHAARGRFVLLRAAGADKEAEIKKLEKEAEEVIEEAERLWKEALEARDNADQLCTIAEELAADTETKVHPSPPPPPPPPPPLPPPLQISLRHLMRSAPPYPHAHLHTNSAYRPL